MTKRFFDYDPTTGMRTDFEATEDGFNLITTQDVEPILDLNKQKKSMGRDYYAKDKDMWKAASIPASVQMKWLVEKGVDVMNPDHWPKVKQLLNDPDYRHLKTAEIVI